MLFQVEMEVCVGPDEKGEAFDRLVVEEKALAQSLQQSGKWRHLWRVVGHYKNTSIFDVDDADELHAILMGLPLYPYMQIRVTPLCRHPSSIHSDDR